MFTTDRDLLILEPNLFRDIGFAGQRLLETTGSTSGTTLTITGDAAAVGITTGHIVLVSGVPLEVVQRLSSTSLQVSRLRADDAAPLIPVPPFTSQPVVVTTFGPQLAMAHGQVLRMLGIDPGAPAAPGAVTEENITNPHTLRLVESLCALHLILSTASALSGPDSALGMRAEFYRQRFAAERQRAAAQIDLDHDGLPDVIRRLNVLQLIRS